jgi:adenine/guanine phosphoribosyltransferase-like PRPP-binding protein
MSERFENFDSFDESYFSYEQDFKKIENISEIKKFDSLLENIIENKNYEIYGRANKNLNQIISKEYQDLNVYDYKINKSHKDSLKNNSISLIGPSPYNANLFVLPGNTQNKLGVWQEAKITAEDLPELAEPIAAFIAEKQPDIVIAADRGGRLVGLAVYKVWKQLYPDKPFPTVDGSLHFARLSKQLPVAKIKDALDLVISASGKHAREDYVGHPATSETPLKVMVIDDWICGGNTHRLVQQAFEEFGFYDGQDLEIMMAVMCGRNAHISGNVHRDKTCEWHDNDESVGVAYDQHSTLPTALHSSQAKDIRDRLDNAIKARYEAGRPVEQAIQTRWMLGEDDNFLEEAV